MTRLLEIYHQQVWYFYWKEYIWQLLLWCVFVIAVDIYMTWQARPKKEELYFSRSRSHMKADLSEVYDPWYYDVFPEDINSLDGQLRSKDVLAELYLVVEVNSFVVQDFVPDFTDNLWRNGRPAQRIFLPLVVTQDNEDSYTVRIARELDYHSFSSEFEVEKTEELVKDYENYQAKMAAYRESLTSVKQED